MTLVLACSGSCEIVVAADRKVYQGGTTGYVDTSPKTKLKKLGSRCIMACAGSPMGYLAADELGLTSLDLSPSDYHVRLKEFYRKHEYRQECSVLLATFEGSLPTLTTFTLSTSNNTLGPEPRDGGITAIGAHKETALLLLRLWHSANMNTQQRKELVHMILCLVANHEMRVGSGVDIAVVTPKGVSIEDGTRYEETSKRLLDDLKALLPPVESV